MTSKPAKPTHNVYVVQGEGEASRWVRIGAAWPNADGKGFNVKLDAAPLIGRIVMREQNADVNGGEQ